ncbi:MAG: class I SAM-dependent methyltransferase [Bacteroidota bacterium]
MPDYQRYQELISRESRHWGEVRPDPDNPQLWHDPELYEIFFGIEYRSFIERIVAKRGTVLELGCGEGKLALELAQRGMTVTAIDLSMERVERANETARLSGFGSRITFLVDDLNTASLPPETYDCVVAHDALHHILEIDRLCEEVRKSLKPGGSFIVWDFVGMGPIRKLFAALLYAVVPTYQPYMAKWNLRHRLPAFLAGERSKRAALEKGTSSLLHPDSPFEEISQRSMIDAILKRFTITERRTFAPFFYYLAPKVRFPRAIRYSLARSLKRADEMLLRLRFSEGAYFFLEARKD